MNPDDWDRVKSVFSSAIGVEAAEQTDFVRRACASRPDLAAAVDELLRAHCDASQGFLAPARLPFAPTWLFQEGDRVADRFRVVKRIARGAMGEVYDVDDQWLRTHVALKAIRPELLADTETVERFRREVRVTRNIGHEGICRVYDLVEHVVGADRGLPAGTTVPCLTMQLLEGETLEGWLQAHRPLSTALALPLVRQITSALSALHEAGIVHRDLKPSNVMLVGAEAQRRAVLMDFGLAKPLEEGLFQSRTVAGGGAPYFMAPELFEPHGAPSRASDIYALGLVIDEMITATRAFPSESLHALLLQKLGDGPLAPGQRSADLPGSWERVILRCLEREPHRRFASAHAVHDALAAGATDWMPAVLWRRYRRQRRRWRAFGYTTAATVGLLGIAAVDPSPVRSATTVSIGSFENLTRQDDLAYLSAGTKTELTNRLTRSGEFRVYSPPGPRDTSRPAVRAEFGITGGIQRAGSTLRISVQLADASGAVQWSRSFDGSLDGALFLEDRLAAETVAAIQALRPRSGGTGVYSRLPWSARAGKPSQTLPPRAGTNSRPAFDAYLRARHLFENRDLKAASEAVGYLQQAIDYDPAFADAYAALADVQGVFMDYHTRPHADLLMDAEAYATRAVTLDPALPDAQLSLAALRQLQWRWTDAQAAYLRAIELNDASARAHRWYGGLLLQFADVDAALAQYRIALALDPYDYASQAGYGHALFNAGRPLEAVRQLERTLEHTDITNVHVLVGQAYAFLARPYAEHGADYLAKALEHSDVIRQRDAKGAAAGTPVVSQWGDLIAALAWTYSGNHSEAAPYLQRLLAGRATNRVSPGSLARVYAAQGDHARAMQALLEAESEHDRELYYLNISPYYAGLRHEPQFRALVARLGLAR